MIDLGRFTRRGAIRRVIGLGAGAAIAASGGGKLLSEATGAMPSGAFVGMSGIGGADARFAGEISQGRPLSAEARKLSDLYNTMRAKGRERKAFRVRGLDPDIDSLKSLPRATKVRMQMARDEARESWLDDMLKRAFGAEP